MQYAKCTTDGQVWEALPFSVLPASLLDTKRLNLICVECEAFAWFRKESRHGHPAHFCARHNPDCSLKVEYVISEDSRNDATTEENQISAGNTIIVRLDEEKGGDVDVPEVKGAPQDGLGQGGRTYTIKGKNRESAQQFTLRKILHRLVQSPSFRDSDSDIIFYKNSEDVMLSGQVRSIVTSFESVEKLLHDGKMMFYWGPIASAKTSDDGKIWLNSGGRYRAVSVALFPNITKSFLHLFNIEDLEELSGAYVLVAGRCSFTGNGEGKPVIWCGNPKYIFVRKYRSVSLSSENIEL